MTKQHNADELLERTAEQIRARSLPEQEAEAISRRVWEKLSQAEQASSIEVDELQPIRSCADYQALIPAFLDGNLSRSRRTLLEGHSRECLPCRKALNAARSGKQASETIRIADRQRRPYARWAVAAALVAAVGFGSYWAVDLMPMSGQAAEVEVGGGEVFMLAAAADGALEPGAGIDYGQRIRTGPGESALIRLRDGSLLEVRERSWLSLRANRRGTTVDLERGGVIVEAAPQRESHLYVSTGDCLVSVIGTIFSVNHGTKGSRVSVIEGEVMVDAGGREEVLHPGQQAATHASLAMIPVSEEIAWSRDVDRYIELMQEVSALRQALVEQVPRPELRYSSRLIEMVPADSSLFVSLPNLGETIAEADRILRERVDESRLLKQWFESRGDFQEFGPSFDEVTNHLAELGSYLGEEVVVTARFGDGEDVDSPLVLAELRDAAGLRRFVEEQMTRHHSTDNGDEENHSSVAFLDDPAAQPAEDAEMYVWMGDDTMVAAGDIDSLRTALGKISGGGDQFTSTPFGQRILEAYREGAGVVIAVDIKSFTAAEMLGEEDAAERASLEETGLLDAEHFLMEQKWVDGKTQHRAVLGFQNERQGMAAWLAAPAPMGALDFISPDAKFAASFLLVDPTVMFDDVLRICCSSTPEMQVDLDKMEEELGMDLRTDIAAAFGGEVAMAVDGPLLPEPSWKVVLEVYDPIRVAFVMQQLVVVANEKLVEAGKEPLSLTSETVGNRLYWSLAGGQSFHFTFEDGYLIAAPSRGLLDRAIRYRESGYTLVSSSKFRSLLPVDGQSNFSAIFYQDAMSLLEPLAERIASQELSEEQRSAIEALAGESGPTLGYAYGEPNRIVFAASGTMNLLDAGLPSLLGLGGSFEMDGLFKGIMGQDFIDQDGADI